MTTELNKPEEVVPQTISISRALSWFKNFDSTFPATISRLGVGDVFKGGVSVNNGKAEDLTRASIQNNIKSMDDLIQCAFDRRNAIAESNLKTTIKVGERTMTISEALVYKAHIVPYLEAWIKHIESQNRLIAKSYANEIASWENRIKDLDAEGIEAMKKSSHPTMVDSKDYVDALVKEVNDFLRDLDGALNESNALTHITM